MAVLDSEALYTLAGQIKPVSEGFWRTYFPIEFGDLGENTTSRVKTIGFSTNSGNPINAAPPIGGGIAIHGDSDKMGWIDFE